MKSLEGAFNKEKALVGAFSLIVQPVVEPMEHYTALFQVGAPPPAAGAEHHQGQGGPRVPGRVLDG